MHSYAVRARQVVGCLLLGALAGCGGDPPTPPPLTPTTSSTSPTPSSTEPVEPLLPDAAKEATEAGAKTFAEFYWQDVVSYAQATGDTRLLRRLSAATCYPCDGGADAIEDIYARNGVIRGGQYSLSGIRTVQLANTPPRYALTFQLHNVKQVVDFPGKRDDGGFAASTVVMRFNVDFLDGKWWASHWESEK